MFDFGYSFDEGYVAMGTKNTQGITSHLLEGFWEK